MTFVLFLISLLVIERILNQPHARRESSDRNAAGPEIPKPAEPALAPGLIALDEAISRHGRGQPADRLHPAGLTSPPAELASPSRKTPAEP